MDLKNQIIEAVGTSRGINIDKLTESIEAAVQRETIDDVREFTDKMISHASILLDGRYKYSDYVKAVKYVTLKLMDYTNQEAYKRVFPDRYERIRQKAIDNGVLSEDEIEKRVSAYVSAYNSGELVNKIYEQTIIPDHIINAPIRQKAILKLVELMDGYKVPADVKQKSAEALLKHLKPPEESKVQLDVTVANTGIITELMSTIEQLSAKQLEHIQQNNLTVRDVAEMDIITIEEDG